jgi:hypothetical protein
VTDERQKQRGIGSDNSLPSRYVHLNIYPCN